VLTLLVTASLLGLRGDDKGGSDPPDTNTNDLIELLTVTTTTVDCKTLVKEDAKQMLDDGTTVIDFEVGALLPVADGSRKWSDALSTPVRATTPADALKEIQAAICQDPLFGATVAHMFAHYEVEDVKVVDLNDWLLPFKVDASQINDLAAGFIPLLDVTVPTNEQLTAAISQNLVYQELAEKLGTLLDRFSVVGIMSEQSVLNYHLVSGGLVTGKLPEIGLNPNQENLPALVLELNAKPGTCLARIGFNVGDKRPEIFSCPTPTSPPGGGSTTAPPGTTSPPTTSPSTTTTTIGGKDAGEKPPQDPVVTCPSGQFADRDTGQCVPYSATTTTVYDNSGGDSGPGAPGTGVTTPTTDPAPDPTVPTNTGPGDGSIPDPGV
jgi:hypothetical protein